MELLGRIGGGAFVLASLVLGLRLLWLASRTRRTPELAMGLALFLMGGVGYPLLMAARLAHAQPEATRVALMLASQLLMWTGGASLGFFNWRVFRPHQRWPLALAGALVGAQIALFAWQGLSDGLAAFAIRDDGPYQWHPVFPCIANAWSAAESFALHARLARRQRLGLAEPEVVDRVRLWAFAASAAATIGAYTTALKPFDIDPASHPLALAVIGSLGLVASGLLFLAFFPPAPYRRRLARSRGAA